MATETTTKVSADTIARTIVLVLALVNQVLAVAGRGTISIAESDIYQVVSLIWTIAASLTAWWKNNSFTLAALRADLTLDAEKESEAE